MRYHDKNLERVKYVICKTQEEFDQVWEEMTKSLLQGAFFRETLSRRGLIIYKIRDYKLETKDEIGCPICGEIFKKKTIGVPKMRDNGQIYQYTYACPKCNIDLGYEWIG